MDKSLIIPKNRLRPSLALAGIGSIACLGAWQGRLGALLEDTNRSTGSNVMWLEKSLPSAQSAQTTDLYLLTIQRTRNLTGELYEIGSPRTDRETLLSIKNALSLSAIQLAKAMGVSRTALYQWIEESKTMRPKARSRLGQLKHLSSLWSEKVGAPISRSQWVSGADRARLAEFLADQSPAAVQKAETFLEELAASKPAAKRTHRSILDITRERNWKKLPDHVRQAERSSRMPSAGSPQDPA
jgi:hypothetical protein